MSQIRKHYGRYHEAELAFEKGVNVSLRNGSKLTTAHVTTVPFKAVPQPLMLRFYEEQLRSQRITRPRNVLMAFKNKL